ncbi:hypothetical protein ACWIGI_18100 [Nocardia sp. NPDC055321]
MELGKDPRDGEHTNAGATADHAPGRRSPHGTAELPAVWGQPAPAAAAPPPASEQTPNYPPTTPFPALGNAPAASSTPTQGAYPPPPAGGYDPMPPFPAGGDAGYDYPPNPHGYNPYGPYTPVTVMPSAVKAARVIAFLFGGLGIAVIVAATTLGNAYLAGAAVGGFFAPIVLAGLAFAYGSGGNGLRVTSIVFAVITAFMGLGGAASQSPPGPLGFIVGVALVILLSGRNASAWFKRPRDTTPAA